MYTYIHVLFYIPVNFVVIGWVKAMKLIAITYLQKVINLVCYLKMCYIVDKTCVLLFLF